ncbi:MAG TPA: hypothetical protein VGG89_14605 [Candidatus Baltobacteraceae bacterium]
MLLVVLGAPSPQPALKTIVTVHSSPFCTALANSVKPALAGLMRNDQLIDLGRSALMAGDRNAKYGGEPTSSFNQQGPAQWSPTSGQTAILDSRQRQLASAIDHNVATIETILSDPKHLATGSGTQEQANLAAIKSQLSAVLDRQHTAANILAGTADTSDLASLFNAGAVSFINGGATGQADPLNGLSPLQARLTSQKNIVKGAGSTSDPVASSQVRIAQASASRPLYSPYEKLADAMRVDQILIGRSENAASQTIVDAAVGCK